MKNCKNCYQVKCLISGNSFPPAINCSEWRPGPKTGAKIFTITSGKAQEIVALYESGHLGAAIAIIRQLFLPKQAYCCDAFNYAVNTRDIFTDIQFEGRWLFGETKHGIKVCPNCGKTPIPPIRDNDEKL